jgi:PIN domain nuclease of toxin-antitoxin system
MGGLAIVKLLLDTHIFIWSLRDPARLSRRVAAALGEAANEKWLSPISIWETLLLAERGRLALKPDPIAWVRNQIDRLPLLQAPIIHEVAIESRVIDLPHDDPADRFLTATARVYELTLVTADDRLLGTKSCAVLANR